LVIAKQQDSVALDTAGSEDQCSDRDGCGTLSEIPYGYFADSPRLAEVNTYKLRIVEHDHVPL
jgi:hypothetical protein